MSKKPPLSYTPILTQEVKAMDLKSPEEETIALLPSNDESKDSAEGLLSDGEAKLLQGHLSNALELFKEVDSLISNNPIFHYRQGLALFEYGTEEECEQTLLLASKKFKQAYQLEPHDIDILRAWGNTLTLLGERLEEHHFFVSAKEKYEKALGLCQDSGELFWDHAVIWYHIGVHSGEAVDLQKALQSFERAIETTGVPVTNTWPSEFWIDYGATALLLSTKLFDTQHIIKAVNCFKHAVLQDEDCVNSHSSLAEALQMLFTHTHDEDHFMQANEAFSTASKLAPQETEVWAEWAEFLLASAKANNNTKQLRTCLEKCHRAYACNGESSHVLAIWAESLALLGQLTDRLDLIYEAENKISEALELDDTNPAIWESLGSCFCAFGSYFNDYDYYYQAIEKFQAGLSIDRSSDSLWHAIANTYMKVGILEDNLDSILQSLKFYEKALAIAPSGPRNIDYAKALSKIGEMTHDQKWLEQALHQFETALSTQKNAVYLHPEWLFSYASTLDMLGDFHDDEKFYTRAIELFSHVLMVNPDYPGVHHRLAQTLCHLGELASEVDYFYRAIHHLRLALRNDEDNDHMILDWGITLINISQHTPILTDVPQLLETAEQKLTRAAKLGNIQAYYHLACLCSLLNEYDQALHFLQKAEHFQALPPVEELLNDDWLDNFRASSQFEEFVAKRPYLQEER